MHGFKCRSDIDERVALPAATRDSDKNFSLEGSEYVRSNLFWQYYLTTKLNELQSFSNPNSKLQSAFDTFR